MRICSLLPSATEILYVLGLGDDVVGVSHECDFPEGARSKPRATRTSIDQERLSSGAIDEAVRASLRRGESLYELDAELLDRLRPDLVVTQQLCEVCAVGPMQIARVLQELPSKPRVVSLHPHTLEEMLEEVRLLGEATDRRHEAGRVIEGLRQRMERVRERTGSRPRPAVFCLEWLSPPMACGHWVPEQVACAGGREVLGRAGQSSRSVRWEEVVAAQPEVLILMPCGFPIERTQRELSLIASQPRWRELPAVRKGAVHVVDGPAYFNGAGPRLIDGIELLAGLLHPVEHDPLLTGKGVPAPL
jgi:iron complex transport system substrate-binding protein